MRLISWTISVLNALLRLIAFGVVSLFALSYGFDAYYNGVVNQQFIQFSADVDAMMHSITYDENGCVMTTPRLIAQGDSLLQAIIELQNLSQIGFELEVLRPFSDPDTLTEYVLDGDDISNMRDLLTKIDAALAQPVCDTLIPLEPIPDGSRI